MSCVIHCAGLTMSKAWGFSTTGVPENCLSQRYGGLAVTSFSELVLECFELSCRSLSRTKLLAVATIVSPLERGGAAQDARLVFSLVESLILPSWGILVLSTRLQRTGLRVG
jgi:hypothetical protein